MLFCLLLFRDTNGTSSTAGSLGMLTTDTETPVMTHTTMGTDFLKSFKIFTHFGIKWWWGQLCEFTINNIFLSIQKPIWNFVLTWIEDDCDNSFNLKQKIKQNLGEFIRKNLINNKPLLHCILQRVLLNRHQPFSKQYWHNDDQHL